MADRWIVIPRWNEFQHPDVGRSTVPPWIKNYTRLLHDDAYLSLTMPQRGLLHGLWLMYASYRRSVNEELSRRHLVTNKAEASRWARNLDALQNAGFIEIHASKPASTPASKPQALEVEVDKERPSSEVTRKTKATPPPFVYQCPACSITAKTTRELRDHLDNVHWLEGDQLEDALAKAGSA